MASFCPPKDTDVFIMNEAGEILATLRRSSIGLTIALDHEDMQATLAWRKGKGAGARRHQIVEITEPNP